MIPFDALEAQYRRFRAAHPDLKDNYDRLQSMVIETFLPFGREDEQNGLLPRAQYVYHILHQYLCAIEESTQRIAAGEKQPVCDAQPAVTPLSLDRLTFRNQEGRAVFFIGFGHGSRVRREIPLLHTLNCNIIQNEWGPDGTVFPAGTFSDDALSDPYKIRDGAFDINVTAFAAEMQKTLDLAQTHNTMFDLLVSPHYFPKWMFEQYPETRSNNGEFLKHDIYSRPAIEMFDAYLRAILPIVKDHPALFGICLSNEPLFNMARDGKNEEKWIAYLTARYDTIDALNAAWGTTYASFFSVGMPLEKEETPRFYHFNQFQSRMFADWHRHIADTVHGIAPHLRVHTKVMSICSTHEWDRQKKWKAYGTDFEYFADFQDLNGNDGWAFFGRKERDIPQKLMWYDVLSSVKPVPVFNSEDHIVQDRDANYGMEQALHVYTDLFQGALHGRSASAIWIWERTTSLTNDASGSFLHRPDCVEATGRAALDLNRHAEIAAAIQSKAPDAALCYFGASRFYHTAYENAFYQAYTALLAGGYKTRILTGSNLRDLAECRLVLVPDATHVTDAEFAALCAAADEGKSLVIADTGHALWYNENGRMRDPAAVAALKARAVLFPAVRRSEALVSPSLSAQLRDWLHTACRPAVDVTVTDAESNQPLADAEQVAVVWTDGAVICNICLYDARVMHRCTRVRLTYQGVPVAACTNLLTGQTFGDTVPLTPLTPVLLRLGR